MLPVAYPVPADDNHPQRVSGYGSGARLQNHADRRSHGGTAALFWLTNFGQPRRPAR